MDEIINSDTKVKKRPVKSKAVVDPGLPRFVGH
jgi:hypothetical protein